MLVGGGLCISCLKYINMLSLPPGRPIVNGINSVSARLGQYIDYFLKPLVTTTTEYLKNTKHVIQIMETIPCNENSLLVTADVSSLYTIIDHQDALMSVKWALDKSDLPDLHKILMKSLEFCHLERVPLSLYTCPGCSGSTAVLENTIMGYD